MPLSVNSEKRAPALDNDGREEFEERVAGLRRLAVLVIALWAVIVSAGFVAWHW